MISRVAAINNNVPFIKYVLSEIIPLTDQFSGNRVAMRAERVVSSIYVTALGVNRMMNHSMKKI